MPEPARRMTGVFAILLLAGASSAGALEVPAAPSDEVLPEVLPARLIPLQPEIMAGLWSLEVGPEGCGTAQTQAQEPQRQTTQTSRRRQSRMFGWLWRSTRNIDIEKVGAPLLFYLRSPLLSGLPERNDCPDGPSVAASARAVATCAAVAVNTGHEDAWNVAIALPQLDAGSPGKLAETLRMRLSRGESVTLRAMGGNEIEFDPDRVRRVEARGCVADA